MWWIAPVMAAEVIVFGDSWAEGAADELEGVLQSHGRSDLDVDPRGVGGTTAEYWATVDPAALPNAILANPDAEWVWLSIGGNDTFGNYIAGEASTNAAQIEGHVRSMLDGAFAANPDIKIVNFGYDFVNFEQSNECILMAWTYFPVGTLTYQINTIFLTDIGLTMARIAEDYPNFSYVDSVWGTLQRAGGISDAPNILYPSPSAYMSDCIHPNSTGYELIHQALWDAYWGQDAPVAAFVPDTADVCSASLTLTDASVGADRIAWTIDGVAAGSDSTVSLDLSVAGSYTVALRTDAGAWHDEETREIRAWSPANGPIEGPDSVPVGALAQYAVPASDGSTYAWDIQDGSFAGADNTAVVEVSWPSAGARRLVVTVTDPCGAGVDAFFDVEVSSGGADSGSGVDDSAPGDAAPSGVGNKDSANAGCSCVGAPGANPPLGVIGLGVLLRRRRSTR